MRAPTCSELSGLSTFGEWSEAKGSADAGSCVQRHPGRAVQISASGSSIADMASTHNAARYLDLRRRTEPGCARKLRGIPRGLQQDSSDRRLVLACELPAHSNADRPVSR